MNFEERLLNYKTAKEKVLNDKAEFLLELQGEDTKLSPNCQIDPASLPPQDPNVTIFFFDLDNTLYSHSLAIHHLMEQNICQYMMWEMGIQDRGRVVEILRDYYHQFGISLIGLINDYKVDPLEYNKMVDDSVPLHKLLHRDPKLRQFLLRCKQLFDKLWLFTNSYKNHAIECLQLLGVADLFDGITYCDYRRPLDEMYCKPDVRFYQQLKFESGLGSWKNSWFVDDNIDNIRMAKSLGIRNCFYINTSGTNASTGTSQNIITITDILQIDKYLNDSDTQQDHEK